MSKKEIITGASVYLVSNISSRILNMLFIIIITRLVGAAGVGLIGLSISVRTIAESFGILGMGMSTQRYLSGVIDSDQRIHLGGMLLINSINSALIMLLLTFGSHTISSVIFNEPNLAKVLSVIGGAVVFTMPINLFRAIFSAQKQVTSVFSLNLIESLSKLLGLLLVIFINDTTLAIAFAILFSSIISAIWGGYLFLKLDLKPIFKVNAGILKGIFQKSIPFFLIGLSYFLLVQTDRLMIGVFLTVEDVGYYIIASTIAQVLLMIHSSIVSIFMPQISEKFRSQKTSDINEIYRFSTKISSIINAFLFTFLLFFGFQILQMFFSINSLNAYYVLLILSFSICLGAFVGPSGALLSMTNNQNIELLNSSIQIVLNIFLNYLFIMEWGVIGAAFATLLSGIVLNALQIYEIYSKLKINLTMNPFFILLFILLVMSFYKFFYIQDISVYTNLVIFSVMIIINVCFFYFTLDDLERLKTINFLKVLTRSISIKKGLD